MSSAISGKTWMKVLALAVLSASLAIFFFHRDGAQQALEGPESNFYRENNVYAELEGFEKILKLQNAFIRNAKKIKPTVASINGLRELNRVSVGGRFGLEREWLANFKTWLTHVFRKQYEMKSLGSGLILNNRGYILTNYHVVEGYDRFLVQLSDERKFSAEKIGVDPKTDLAVLKIFSIKGFPTPEFGSAKDLKVGEWVMAIGNPYGLRGTVTVGVISGIGRSNLGITVFENFIQTDASINPGNSGGPLIDLDGKIVGINTAVAEIGSGVGFAIPIDMAMEIADELIENGEVERGWLGIGIQPLTPELAITFKAGRGSQGVLVNSVDEGAPAQMSGLRQGDIILSYNGNSPLDTNSLQRLVAGTDIGQVALIKILRQGREKILHVKVGKLKS